MSSVLMLQDAKAPTEHDFPAAPKVVLLFAKV